MGKNKDAHFKAVESEWYEKLKQEGFEDIEYAHSESKPLKQYASQYFIARTDPLSFENKQNYYQRASQFLHDYLFRSDQEKRIWELHSEGKTLRAIAEILGDRNKDTVAQTIHSLKQAMFSFSESETQEGLDMRPKVQESMEDGSPDWMSLAETMNFCLGSAIECLWRAAPEKDTQELESAIHYITREIDRRKRA